MLKVSLAAPGGGKRERSSGAREAVDASQDRQDRASHAATGSPRERRRGSWCDHAPGPVTHQPLVTTRRPPLPSSASSGRGDTGRHGPWPHRSRCRSSPAQRIASRGRDGARRWVIRWAEPAVRGRIRPNAEHLRARWFCPICRYFVAWRPYESHASHARGRWFETRRAHQRLLLAGAFRAAQRSSWTVVEDRERESLPAALAGPRRREARPVHRLTRERSPV
jgi:hypothetical protein